MNFEVKTYKIENLSAEFLYKESDKRKKDLTSHITERKNSNNSIKIKVEPVEWSLGRNYRNNGVIIKDINLIPRILNVSILAMTEDYELIGQIKGNNTLGGGQILSTLASGHVDGNSLWESNDPMYRTLESECMEETGLELQTLNPSLYQFEVVCYETGNINYVSLAEKQVNLNDLHSSEEVKEFVALPLDKSWEKFGKLRPTSQAIRQWLNYNNYFSE